MRGGAWSLSIDPKSTQALAALLARGRSVSVGELMRAPDNRDIPLGAVPLLLQRSEGKVLLPSPQETLAIGDRLLLCGRVRTRGRLRWTLHDDRVLRYVVDASERRAARA